MPTPALVVVDLQNEYFPGGKMELVGILEAAVQARRVLDDARARKWPIFHIRHVMPGADAPAYVAGTPGVEPHDSVAPQEGEPLITKNQVNCFRDTTLLEDLKAKGVTDLTIIGAMTHVCIDSATRAAVDYGFKVTLVHDACATKDVEFNGVTASAAQVQASYMAALGWLYCTAVSTDDYLKALA
eukprot:NODE_2789_length_740_cov_245.797395_g1963_i0.p1 GENE.NODE_2789_length_740_cov_245.797395_g1963_i0~~NODE_2789_length_740_cov_245.797395_g1963_i0.p1  ORF type:complete len:209 (-),score=76.48 NODE_2789_length_740_cov_245.797395_g1963_i0:114-668(-)